MTGGADITLRSFIVSRRIVYFRGEVVHKGRLFPWWVFRVCRGLAAKGGRVQQAVWQCALGRYKDSCILKGEDRPEAVARNGRGRQKMPLLFSGIAPIVTRLCSTTQRIGRPGCAALPDLKGEIIRYLHSNYTKIRQCENLSPLTPRV